MLRVRKLKIKKKRNYYTIKLVIYIAHYDTKLRKEREIKIDRRKPQSEQVEFEIKKLRKDFIDEFGYQKRKIKGRLIKVQLWNENIQRQLERQFKITSKENKQYDLLYYYGKELKVKKYIRKGKEIMRYVAFRRDWNKQEEDNVLSLFKRGFNYREIAKETKRSYPSVKTKLQRLRGIKHDKRR